MDRITIGDYLAPAAAGAALVGAPVELAAALKVPAAGGSGGVAVPWEVLGRGIERRAAPEIWAFTTTTQNDGPESQRPILQRLFGPGIMDSLGVRIDSVPAGRTEWPLVATGIAPAQVVEGTAAAAVAMTFNYANLKPKRLTGRYEFTHEAAATVADLEAALRRDPDDRRPGRDLQARPDPGSDQAAPDRDSGAPVAPRRRAEVVRGGGRDLALRRRGGGMAQTHAGRDRRAVPVPRNRESALSATAMDRSRGRGDPSRDGAPALTAAVHGPRTRIPSHAGRGSHPRLAAPAAGAAGMTGEPRAGRLAFYGRDGNDWRPVRSRAAVPLRDAKALRREAGEVAVWFPPAGAPVLSARDADALDSFLTSAVGRTAMGAPTQPSPRSYLSATKIRSFSVSAVPPSTRRAAGAAFQTAVFTDSKVPSRSLSFGSSTATQIDIFGGVGPGDSL